MKAPNEMVLLYNLSESENGKKLKGVCLRMGIRIKEIPPELFQQPLGYLANLSGFNPVDTVEERELFSEEMMVLKNFTDKKLDDFLQQMRRSDVSRIALKAVVTEQNAAWDSYQLREELMREHEAVMQGNIATHPVQEEEGT